MTLLQFLEARLAEDEKDACDAATMTDGGQWGSSYHVVNGPRVEGVPRRAVAECASFGGRYAAQHIARHDPARVLAEVESKRYLLRLHAPHEVDGPVMRINGKDQVVPNTNCLSCSDRNPPTWPCATLKALVGPYAGHPDCPPELAVTPES